MRLGVHKGDFGDEGWDECTQEMLDYCQQDVVVTYKLWTHLAPHTWSEEAIRFEHDIAEICDDIGQAGWTFDLPKAQALHATLSAEKIAIEQQLQDLFPPWTIETEFVPKVNNKTRGYVKVSLLQRLIPSTSTPIPDATSNTVCAPNTIGNQQSSPRLGMQKSMNLSWSNCLIQRPKSLPVINVAEAAGDAC